ncbi:aldose 1-epimerase [Streptomyces litmocidini]|uniref:aldose epimerase family protein n=1 Tax=Streptomyces litmocidini TaxID=67318 RepID=UPI00167DDCDA|nr:aldose 1-epimerase [Streptomyces litmocidini]GGV17773.1 aldose 1-epimerase [Streptomyces litmocidini]
MTTNADDVRLKSGDAELTVAPGNGCRISSLRVRGIELLQQGAKEGSFPTVPWCGRLAQGQFHNGGERHQMPVNAPPHSIHGTGRDTAWRVTRTDTDSAAFIYDLADTAWPYPGRVSQLVELTDSSLTLTVGVETGNDSFPAQAGWRPCFRRNLGTGGDVKLDFTPAWQEERGEDQLPTGNRIDPASGPWDDTFGMPDGVHVTLTWPGALELAIDSRAEWVTICDTQPEAIVVEPQSGPPNGLNTSPRLVTLIDPLEFSTTWTWRTLG